MNAAPNADLEPNDPTRTGAPVPGGKGACLSQSEIENLCLKAARGGGMDWGLAEEAGFAAAWLAMRGLDGPGALLAQLRDAQDRPWREVCPVVAPGRFGAAGGGCLCPIALGAALCDHARLPETEMTKAALRIGPVDHPILLLPFLADLARERGHGVRLDWPRGSVRVTAQEGLSGDLAALTAESRLEGELFTCDAAPDRSMALRQTLFVPAQTLKGLDELVMRTTVPASESSRAGAGAALPDND